MTRIFVKFSDSIEEQDVHNLIDQINHQYLDNNLSEDELRFVFESTSRSILVDIETKSIILVHDLDKYRKSMTDQPDLVMYIPTKQMLALILHAIEIHSPPA